LLWASRKNSNIPTP